MATYTEHYNFPKYEATDLPNLLDQYNNFADTADSQIYGMNSTVQAAQQAAQNATSKAESVESEFGSLKSLVGTSTGSGTVFEQLTTLNSEVDGFQGSIDGKAPTDHASSTTEYGIATNSKYGHVRLVTEQGSMPSTEDVPTDAYMQKYVYNQTSAIQSTATGAKQKADSAYSLAESVSGTAESAASDASTALTRANSAYNAINGGWDSVQNGSSGAIDWEVFYNDAAKLVMVAVNFTSSYPKTSGDVTLGTIGSSYRPSETEMGVIAIVITGGSNFGACQAFVNSSGQLKLRFGGVGTNDFAFYSGNMFYPVS